MGFLKSLLTLSKKGYTIFVVTNQSGIARGLYSHEDVAILHNWMKEQFAKREIEIKDFFICPHHPKFSEPCTCRKPQPGMINLAIKKHDISKTESVIIGDKQSDIQAGRNAGLKTTILLSSKYNDEPVEEADYFIDNLRDAVNYL